MRVILDPILGKLRAEFDSSGGGGGGSGITRSVNAAQSGSVSAGSTASTDYVYIFTAAGTLTLPTAVGNTNRYTVKQFGAGAVSVATTSAQTIDGGATASVLSPQSIDLVSNGSNWVLI